MPGRPHESGSHELFGHLVLRGDPLEVLERWIAAQHCSSAIEERDERWWVEEMALVDGSTLHLFANDSSRGAQADRLVRFVEHLLEKAVRGEVVLQHTEDGIQVTEWTVSAGQVVCVERSVEKAIPVPHSSRRAREHFERTTKRHTRLVTGTAT